MCTKPRKRVEDNNFTDKLILTLTVRKLYIQCFFRVISGVGVRRSGRRAQLARHPAVAARDRLRDHGHRAGHPHAGLRGRAAVLEWPPHEFGRAAGRRAAAQATALGLALAAPSALPGRRRLARPLERQLGRRRHPRHQPHHGQFRTSQIIRALLN